MCNVQVLQLANLLRNWTFNTGSNIEAYPIPFAHGFETIGLHYGMMHKNINIPPQGKAVVRFPHRNFN